MADEMIIREMDRKDYAQVIKLWSNTDGIGLNEADSQENINHFLERNQGLSFVAELGGRQIVGAVLCGHDGRRGYLHHLAVSALHRRSGIGRKLVEHCLAKLEQKHIKKCHLFVFTNNQEGMSFWNHIGFYQRNELYIYSKDI